MAQEVLDLATAQPLDLRVVGRSLDAAVPAQVLVVAVAVRLAVGLVVLRVVRDQVVEREAVVTGHEVEARTWFSPLVPVDVRAAEEPLAHRLDRRPVALDERPHVVAEATVPLRPAVADEAADLVQPAGVPRLGDQLGAGQDRVGLDVPEGRRIGHRLTVLVARQDRREVEPEAVDVHLVDPVAQAVEDQPADDRAVRVERVAGAAVVDVGAVAVEQVVVVVGQAAEGEGRPVRPDLRGVVVDDVEDDLEAGPVERLDEVAELVDGGRRVGSGGVGLVRREERDRLIAPVVDQAGRRRERGRTGRPAAARPR